MAINIKAEILLDNVWQDVSEGGETTTFYYPVQLNDTMDESTDTATFEVMNERMELYPRNTPVKMTLRDDNGAVMTRYYLGNDSVKIFRFLKPRIYTHMWSCVELTKQLERVFVYGKAFTQGKDGEVKYKMDEILDILFKTTPPRDYNQPQMFFLDENVREKISQCTPLEFQWSCKMTLYEALLDFGRCINGIPRLLPSLDDDRVYNIVTFDFYDDDKGEVDDIDYNDYQATCAVDYYATELVTYAENVVPDKTVVVPSPNGWVSPRNTTVKYNEEGQYIDLTCPIYKIKKVILHGVKNLIKLDLKNSEGVHRSGPIEVDEIDVTERVTEKSIFDCLQKEVNITNKDLEKGSVFFYEVGGTAIENIRVAYTTKDDFNPNKINCLSNVLLKASLGQEFKITDGSQTFRGICVAAIVIGSDLDWNNVSCRIEFYPLSQNVIIKSRKEGSSGFNQMASNQTTEVVDSKKLGNLAYNTAQRLGNEEVAFTANYTDIPSLPQCGMRYKDYIITNCKYMLTDMNNILVLMELSKDYIRVNEFIGIDRAYRQFAIPQDFVERIIEKDLNICFSKNATYKGKYDDYYKIIGDIIRERPCPKVNNMYIHTEKLKSYDTETNIANLEKIVELALPCTKYLNGKSISFVSEMKDNLVAGRKRDGKLNADIYYADKNGEVWSALFGLIKGEIAINTDTFPELGVNDCPLYGFGNQIIFKDVKEKLKFIYNINFKDDDITVGKHFASKFPLYNGSATGMFTVRILQKNITKNIEFLNDNNSYLLGVSEKHFTYDKNKININNLPLEGFGWALVGGYNQIMLMENVNLATLNGKREFFINIY